MIIKGGSRGAPRQLAWHLQRRDTNEQVEILELQSPAPSLAEAFRDWQTLVEGTRGSKGLYHANIDPAKDYTMTPDQWRRAVDVLEKELKLEGQPRAVVKHEKNGRAHIHVVWARTDIDRMVLRSDSQNYLAHERASQKLEQEFGHEHVPGKHAKRDREKQPEFPRAEANQAEWQQGERTGLKPADRKEQITAIKEACDNGQAFKTALEQQGYILSRGDRGFVIVDEAANAHSLTRQIRNMKKAQLDAFMKGVELAALPSAEEAKATQKERRQENLHQRQHGETPKPDQGAPQEAHASPCADEPDQDRHQQQKQPQAQPEQGNVRQTAVREKEPFRQERRQEQVSARQNLRHGVYQPNIDGLGAIIEVAVTPLTEALRAAFELGRGRLRNSVIVITDYGHRDHGFRAW